MTSGQARPGRGSWRIVWRALRTGHVDDRRYAALTWEAADRNVRNLPLLVFFAIVSGVQVGLMVARLVRGADPSDIALSAAVALCSVFTVGVLGVARRRSRRYLARNGPGHGPEIGN